MKVEREREIERERWLTAGECLGECLGEWRIMIPTLATD